jgi:hypothetical protein
MQTSLKNKSGDAKVEITHPQSPHPAQILRKNIRGTTKKPGSIKILITSRVTLRANA